MVGAVLCSSMQAAAGLAGAVGGYGFAVLVLIVVGVLFPGAEESGALKLAVETPIALGVVGAVLLWRRTLNSLVKSAAAAFAVVSALMFLLFMDG
jgi:hypothetical protein